MTTKPKKTVDPSVLKEEMLRKYPPKVARKRSKQILVNELDEQGHSQEIMSNVRTIPGIITQRGCTYAGLQGRGARTHPGHRQP